MFLLLPLVLLSQQQPQALTNKDIIDLAKVGFNQDIVIAKIKSSKCEFDTSPSALKELKAAGVPDGVILAMIQAPTPTKQDVESTAEGPAKTAAITCINAKNIPAYPMPEVSSTAVANPKCGDKVSILDYHGSWAKIRTEDGTLGWISVYFLPTQAQPAVPTRQVAQMRCLRMCCVQQHGGQFRGPQLHIGNNRVVLIRVAQEAATG